MGVNRKSAVVGAATVAAGLMIAWDVPAQLVKGTVYAATAAAGLLIAFGGYFAGPSGEPSKASLAPSAHTVVDSTRSPYAVEPHPAAELVNTQYVELSASEFEKLKVEPVAERDFTLQREAVGNIGFNDYLSVQVFPPFQGKIINLFANAGDDVQKGKPLYTIDSPDLVQAGSTLISAAGVVRNTTRVLDRAKKLYAVQGIPQKELDELEGYLREYRKKSGLNDPHQ